MQQELTLTRKELEKKFRNARLNNILRTLKNKKIEYKKNGRGKSATITLFFSSPFKYFVFVMLSEWGLPSQINFKNFYLYIKFVLNSSDFASKSIRQQSQIILEQTNIYLNPQTITNYKNILLQKKLLYKSGRAIYYKQTDNGIIEICYKDYIDFTKSRRKKQEEGLDYNAALAATIVEKKGYCFMRPEIVVNGFVAQWLGQITADGKTFAPSAQTTTLKIVKKKYLTKYFYIK